MLVELLQNLFKDDEISAALANTISYIQLKEGQTILVIRALDFPSLQLLNLLSLKIVAKIESLLGYGIYLECLEYEKVRSVDRDRDNMVAVLEQEQSTYTNGAEVSVKLLNLEKLVAALREPMPKVKLMLARQGAAIYPQEDGTEAIAEPIFDALILRWAKSIKEEGELEQDASQPKTRKASTKLLLRELTIEDIARTKQGKASLTATGIQFTLEKFANALNLEDTSLTDAISAFIEGSSEFGKKLRRKLLGYYKKFTPDANLTDVEIKLVTGAKKFLETINTPADSAA